MCMNVTEHQLEFKRKDKQIILQLENVHDACIHQANRFGCLWQQFTYNVATANKLPAVKPIRIVLITQPLAI